MDCLERMMNRQDHEERLAASHARGVSEERDETPQDAWMREATELDAEMKTLLNDIGSTNDSNELQPF